MMLRLLLRVTAVAEGATGLAFLLVPNFPVLILLGRPLDSALPELIGRVAGAALIALGVACWQASEDEESRAAAGLVLSLLIYDVIAAALLAYAYFGLALSGVGLWVALVGHVVLTLWCVAGLRKQRFAAKGTAGDHDHGG
ncbi:hypothetical protein [Rhizobium binae]|nr:hypothetical protein [Rhizobium binae]MBX4994665.1 hypothetical protein [Rhizobium binae]NKL49933.1 hypothetical protein [Rhizobium leguminosarum bv. viciae]QSY85205.1 hypothetical protein J2J99_24485 [Rhizobium binae]